MVIHIHKYRILASDECRKFINYNIPAVIKETCIIFQLDVSIGVKRRIGQQEQPLMLCRQCYVPENYRYLLESDCSNATCGLHYYMAWRHGP